MAKATSYKVKVTPPGGEAFDCDSRFATKDEGDLLAALLLDSLGPDSGFKAECVECNDDVNATMTDKGPRYHSGAGAAD